MSSLRPLVYLTVAAVALYLLWEWLPVERYVREAMKLADGLGWKGWVVYGAAYAVLSLLGTPRTPLNIGAGVLFDFRTGLGVVILSATLALVCAFWITRTFARQWAEKKLRRSRHGRAIADLVEEQSLKLVLLVRLNPFIPGALKDYGFGVTSVPFRVYLLASVLGLVPVAAVHVYLGWVGGLAMVHGEQPLTEAQLWLIALGLVVSALLAVVLFWYGKRSLAKVSGQPRYSQEP